MRYIVDDKVFKTAREVAQYIVENTEGEAHENMMKECKELIGNIGTISGSAWGLINDVIDEQIERNAGNISREWMSENSIGFGMIVSALKDASVGMIAKVVQAYIAWLQEIGEYDTADAYSQIIERIKRESICTAEDAVEYFVEGLDEGGHDVFYGFDVEAIR